MAKPPKCRNCGKEIDKEHCYKINERSYYCNEECYNEKFEKNKAKYKPVKEKPIGTENPRRLFTDYIQKIYMENGYEKNKIGWEIITAQIKNMMAQPEHELWKYEGMQYVLWYMYEIIGVNLFAEESNGSIITLLPFYYQEAQDFYYKVQEISDLVDKFEFEDKEIIVKKSREVKSKYKEISMEDL